MADDSASRVPSDSEPPEKRQKLEKKKQEFDDEEGANDGIHELTLDQLNIYYKMVHDSQGFDVPDFPPTEDFGRIMPITDLNEDLETLEIVKNLSDLAIKYYNDKNGSKYDFAQVVKANAVGVAGLIYYITFEAKDRDDGQSKTFQATVFRGFKSNVEVLSCDPKPT